MTSDTKDIYFSPVANGLVRHPLNIETIHVERESGWTWLKVRRNGLELAFPLTDEHCQHLAVLLLGEDPA